MDQPRETSIELQSHARQSVVLDLPGLTAIGGLLHPVDIVSEETDLGIVWVEANLTVACDCAKRLPVQAAIGGVMLGDVDRVCAGELNDGRSPPDRRHVLPAREGRIRAPGDSTGVPEHDAIHTSLGL